ncbi:MAG: hypothetical protein CMM25_09250 [Rhodospirillaceae bacterium]|jgi:hypothetical protein|nr:hypothetical protein [Rhodospirillaceae bacterium]
MSTDLGFWTKVKRTVAGGQSSNALKVDAIFATDDSGSMNSYLSWEDDPAAVDAFNKALSSAGIGAQNLEILDSNNSNRISRTFFASYKQQVVSNLLLVRTSADLAGSGIALDDAFTVKRSGTVVGTAGDYIVYAWDKRENYYNSSEIFNELVFQGLNNQGAGILDNVLVGDTLESVGGTAYGTVTEVIQLNNPYLYYVEGDLRLRYFWARRAGPTGTYVKNSSNGGSTGANSEDAFGIIHKTIGVNLNCTVNQQGQQVCDDFKPQASSKLVFVANTNEHDTAMPFSLDSTRDLLLTYNGVFVGNIGGYGLNYGPGILPQVRNAADYNGGSNGVSAADPRGFQPIDDYVSDVTAETLSPITALDGIPDGWYRGVEFEIKDVETTNSSAAVQARTRPKVRLDLKVGTPSGGANKTVTVLKVVFPGYGFVVGDTITPPSSSTTTFGALHDILILKVARVKDIYYGSASKKIFSGVYTKDYNRMVFLNDVGRPAAFTVVSGGTGYTATTNTAIAYPFDTASGFNNSGDGLNATVDLTVNGSGVVTAAALNANGNDLYNDGDRLIVANATAGEVLTLDAGSLVGGSGYSNGTSIGTTNLSDLADGLGATVDITVNGSGAITAVTLNAGGINYVAGDVLEIAGGTGGTITVATAKEDCIIQVNGLTNVPVDSNSYNVPRERAYLVKDLNLITRNNDPPTGSVPQTGGVAVTAANQFTVSATAGSNVLTVTATGTGASVGNLSVGNEIWNNANTTNNGSKGGNNPFTLNPAVPWDVKVTAISGNNISMSAAANATASVTVYIGTRLVSSNGWRWDHTTLARETGGAIFFQVGPFANVIGNAPAGIAYWDTSGGINNYGSHAWETVAIFGNLGASTPDYRIQFGRSIGKTVGEYLFKTA